MKIAKLLRVALVIFLTYWMMRFTINSKRNQNKMKKEYYELSAKITRLANRGTHRAQEKARRAGVPVVYAIDGKLHLIHLK